MTRVLDQKEFVVWLEEFLPNLENRKDLSILSSVKVSDRTDPKIVHLDGLNLSRAWCLKNLASYLPQGHPGKELFLKSAKTHANEALQYITSGNYEGEHWLASFAVYLLSK